MVKFFVVVVLWCLLFWLTLLVGQNFLDSGHTFLTQVAVSFLPGYCIIGFFWLVVYQVAEARFERVLWLAVAIAVVFGLAMVPYATEATTPFIVGALCGAIVGHFLLKLSRFMLSEEVELV